MEVSQCWRKYNKKKRTERKTYTKFLVSIVGLFVTVSFHLLFYIIRAKAPKIVLITFWKWKTKSSSY